MIYYSTDHISQDEWNLDKCDGSGPSGYLLDITKMQMIYIDYSWYGAGTIRFGIRGNNGKIHYVHRMPMNNINAGAYQKSGNLPARYEVSTEPIQNTRMIAGESATRGSTLTAYGGRNTPCGRPANGGDLNVMGGSGGVCTDRNVAGGYAGESAFGYGAHGVGWGSGGSGATAGGCEIFWYK